MRVSRDESGPARRRGKAILTRSTTAEPFCSGGMVTELRRVAPVELRRYAEMVARYYGGLLPQDKAEIAARILNQAWEAAWEHWA